MLQVSGLTKSYGARKLFEDISFAVGKGEKIGLVGRNGSGKSTLFKIILGFEESDGGLISIPKTYKLGHLSQHISFTKSTLLEECVQCLPEDQVWDHYKAEKILFGLGFQASDMDRSPTEFSGGYQLRINLTKSLLAQPDLLLLDEPTNYLDILSMRWMRNFLKSFPGEVILITHDRDFMDSVATHSMGIHRGQVKKVQGRTSKYYEQLHMDEEIHEKTRMNREKKLKHMQDFVDRFRAKASKATQAQSVLKKIEKLGVLEEMDAEQILGFRFNYKETAAKRLLEVKDLSFGFKQEEPLFADLNFELKPEECIGVIGKNGKGKTTLLNVISGQLNQQNGDLNFHPTAEVGYYQQTNRKDLNSNLTVAQEIEAANINLERSRVRGICGAMMFSGDDADKKIGILSGGEQGRVLLGKILAHENNILLLDEPTNHLDIESIEVMTEEIRAFAGGVIVVTHNEKMLKRLADKLIVFNGSEAELFDGTYDEFLRKRGWDDEGGAKKNKEPKSKKGQRSSESVASTSPQSKEKTSSLKEQSRILRPLTKELTVIEQAIEEQENELARLNTVVMELVGDSENSNKLQEIYKNIGKIHLDIESKYKEMDVILSKIEHVKKSL